MCIGLLGIYLSTESSHKPNAVRIELSACAFRDYMRKGNKTLIILSEADIPPIATALNKSPKTHDAHVRLLPSPSSFFSHSCISCCMISPTCKVRSLFVRCKLTVACHFLQQ